MAIVDIGSGAKQFTVPISVNGSAPVDVLVDTGSCGLRIFASALTGSGVTPTTQTVSASFGPAGRGFRYDGFLANANVAIGSVPAAPIAFHYVSSTTCPASDSACVTRLTDRSIAGILGIGLRAHATTTTNGVYSPVAQLPAPYSNGFLVHSGGSGASQGVLVLGVSVADLPGFAALTLAPDQPSSLPNGTPAWADTAITTCFSVNGQSLDPACSPAVFDTGATTAVVYVTQAPGSIDGATFEATVGAVFDDRFVVEGSTTDAVNLNTTPQMLSTLGIQAFFADDIAFDVQKGLVGFRPIAP